MARPLPPDWFIEGIDDYERFGLCEYRNGKVVPKDTCPPPRGHAKLRMELLTELKGYLDLHPIAEALPSLHCRFPNGDVLCPDISVVSFQPEHNPWEPHPRAPELAVEILSPSDRISLVTRNVDCYLRNGVRVVWLIHMESREATIHAVDEEVRLIPESGRLTAEAVLPGLSIPLAAALPRAV